jgi:hypothetical protein
MREWATGGSVTITDSGRDTVEMVRSADRRDEVDGT